MHLHFHWQALAHVLHGSHGIEAVNHLRGVQTVKAVALDVDSIFRLALFYSLQGRDKWDDILCYDNLYYPEQGYNDDLSLHVPIYHFFFGFLFQ